MIVERTWRSHRRGGGVRRGWFLFGLLPLYIQDLTVRED